MFDDTLCIYFAARFEEKIPANTMAKQFVLSFDNRCIDGDTHYSQVENHPFENNPMKLGVLYDDSECCYNTAAEGQADDRMKPGG
jgi:hypothetical protein